MITPGRHQFVALNGLRGVVALLVVAYHATDTTMKSLLPEGYLGVDLFFVLSGFVISHAYQARLDADMTVRRFMLARLIRLYPIYLLGTLLGLALLVTRVALHQHPVAVNGMTIAAALVFLPSPARVAPFAYLYPLDFPAWSLMFEIGINLVYAVIARHLTDRRLAAVIGLGAVLLLATTAFYGRLNVGYTWSLAAGGVGRVVFAFFAGVAVERLWRRGWWPAVTLPPLAGVGIAVAIFVITPGPWRAGYDAVVVLAVIPLLILVCARREPSQHTARAFAAAGTASYAVFILHVPVRDWLISVAPHLTGRQFSSFGLTGTFVFVGVAVAVAFAADRFFDEPVRAWLTTRFRRGGGRVITAGAVVAEAAA